MQIATDEARVIHPQFAGPVQYTVTEVSDDPDTQVEQVIGMMTEYATSDARSEAIGRVADWCRRELDPWLSARNAWKYAHNQLRFQRDEATAGPFSFSDDVVEVLVRPVDLCAEIMKGNRPVEDCDGFSMFLAAVLCRMNIACSFVTVAADQRAPDRYSHVYVVAYPDGQRIALDASHGSYPGWECPNLGKMREWPVNHSGGSGGLLARVFALGVLAGAGYYLFQMWSRTNG